MIRAAVDEALAEVLERTGENAVDFCKRVKLPSGKQFDMRVTANFDEKGRREEGCKAEEKVLDGEG